MDFTTDNLEKAVIEFYRSTDVVNNEAHEWLKKCQMSIEAWTIVWPLLDPSTKIPHVQYMAAKILNYKVTRCLSEVPDTDLLNLKEKLLSVVAKYILEPQLVLNPLGLALGAFIGYTIGTSWESPFDDLVNLFKPQNFSGVSQECVYSLLIQIFGFIPEMSQNHWQKSNEKLRRAAKEIQNKGDEMFSWLFGVIREGTNSTMVVEGLKAFLSWTHVSCVFDWAHLPAFTQHLVGLCSDEVTVEPSLDLLTAIACDPKSHEYPRAVTKLLEQVLPLQVYVSPSLARNDYDIAASYFGLYVGIAETHSGIIVDLLDEESVISKEKTSGKSDAIALLDIILSCTATKSISSGDETLSTITFAVWHSLVDDVQRAQEEGGKFGRVMTVLDYIYQQLGGVLVRKAAYPVESRQWNVEERESFRIYRQDVSDCISRCYELRGPTFLNELTSAASQSLDSLFNETSDNWAEVESILLGIHSLLEIIGDESENYLQGPLTAVFTLLIRTLEFHREKHVPKLFSAALDCISCSSSFIPAYEGVAERILPYVLQGLKSPDTISSSALTLKTLSRDAPRALAPFTSAILNATRDSLCSGEVSGGDAIRLVYSVGRFLAFLPKEESLAAVDGIFSPMLARLHILATLHGNSEIRGELLNRLHIFSTLCSSLDASCWTEEEIVIPESEQPLLPVFENLLPVLTRIAESWGGDRSVMESLLAIPKAAIGTLQGGRAVEGILPLLLLCLQRSPVEQVALLSRQVIIQLEKSERRQLAISYLAQLHCVVMGPPCLLSSPRNNGNEDFVEAYFITLGQLMRGSTKAVLEAQLRFENIFVIAIECVGYPETGLLKSSIYFLSIAADKSASFPQLRELFYSMGASIVQRVFYGIGVSVPRSGVHHYADIFICLNKSFPAEFRAWVRNCIDVQGFPHPSASLEAKRVFEHRLTERPTKRSVQQGIEDFALSCRNMSGSEYASATSYKF